MRPLSPIATLVLLSGSAGVLELYPTDPGYDPSSSSDYVAPAPTTLAVKGVYSTSSIGGVEVSHDALYMVDLTVLPDGLQPEKSHCTVNGMRMIVMLAHDRWWMNARDGLTLHLAHQNRGSPQGVG